MSETPRDEKYISSSELEVLFNRKIRAIRRWEGSKNFPPPVITGSGTDNLWLRSQVEEWEDAQVAKVPWSLQPVSKTQAK